MKNQLHALSISKPRDWDKKLGGVMWAYNNSPQSMLGLTPYHLVFGHPGASQLVALKRKLLGETGVNTVLNRSDREYVDGLMDEFKGAHDIADQVAHGSQQAYVEQYNKHAKKKVFSVGDGVLVLRPSSTNALKSSWIGPCTVEEAVVGNAYMARFPDGGRRAVHASELRVFIARLDQEGVVFDQEECQIRIKGY